MPSSLSSQLMDIVDTYHFTDDSLKIQSLVKLEQAFVDYLITDALAEFSEDQRSKLADSFDFKKADEFLTYCKDNIPHREKFIEESLEDFKHSVVL